MYEIGDFKDFIKSNVLTQQQWPTHAHLHAQLTRITDAKRHMNDTKHGEIKANSATLDEETDYQSYAAGAQEKRRCFNCGGYHMARNCSKSPSLCTKCGQQGHIPEFCDHLQSLKKANQQSKTWVPERKGPYQTERRMDYDATRDRRQEKVSDSFKSKNPSQGPKDLFNIKNDPVTRGSSPSSPQAMTMRNRTSIELTSQRF
jgi:hypothetical protein